MNTPLPLALLLFGVIWPVLLAFTLAFKMTRPLALGLAPWAALPALAASLLVTPREVSWHLTGWLLGSDLGLDATGQVFLLLAALLWVFSGIYARAYFSQPGRRARFFVFFLLAMGGNFGLIVAQDMPSFYLFFAMMSFASYGLVIFEGNAAALRAGWVYIVLVVAGELMLFAAFLIAAHTSGAMTFDAVRVGLIDSDSRNLVILLGLFGFGIKAGLLGLHVWLPLAHPVAPTPASAVLSGAMISAGLLGWLRLFPLGDVGMPDMGVSVLILGLAAAFYGAGVGLTQREPKTLLAYSSISQMGIMTMAIGLGLLVPQAWSAILPVVAFYALHHGLSKEALFLGAGLSGSYNRLHRRWVWLGLWLPALALAGAPWTSGMLAKLLLKAQVIHAPTPWDSLLPILLLASAVATALLMARFLYLVRPASQPSGVAPIAGLVWPWFASLLAVLVVPFWLAQPMPEPGNMQVVDALWPVLLACVVSLIVMRTGLFRSVEPLPAGDVLVVIEKSFQMLQPKGDNWAGIRSFLAKVQVEFRVHLAGLLATFMAISKRTEDNFSRWDMAGLLFVMAALGAGFLAWLP